MMRLNTKIQEEKEKKLIEALYEHMCHLIDDVDNDIEGDYLSCAAGRDGKDYFWYFDENTNVAIDMDGSIIDDKKVLEELFE